MPERSLSTIICCWQTTYETFRVWFGTWNRTCCKICMTKMLLPVLCGLFGCTLSANALFFIEPPVSYPSIDTAASLSFGVDLDSSLADRSSTTPFSDFDGGGTIDYTPNVSIMVTFNDPSSDAIYITALLGLNDIGPIHGTITPVGGPAQCRRSRGRQHALAPVTGVSGADDFETPGRKRVGLTLFPNLSCAALPQ